MRFFAFSFAAMLALSFALTLAVAHEHTAAKTACNTTELACANLATGAFDPQGNLWVTWVAAGRVSVASSLDRGRSFSSTVTLPATDLPIDDGPDARPKLAFATDGRAILSFATRDDKYFGRAFMATSADGGKTFNEPEPFSDSPSQRFETVAFDKAGRAFIAWIDKGNAQAAKAAGKPYAGAALAFAWLDKTRGKISRTSVAHDNTCECCRIAVAFAGDKPVVLFRNIFEGGVRDHAVITFDGAVPGPLHRVSEDDAKIDACPHQGPSLAIGEDGTYHATWFALGRKLKGLYYARSVDGGKSFSKPMPLGDGKSQISRPSVLASGDNVYLAYKSFDGTKTSIEIMTSRDHGKTWSAPYAIASTEGTSDHPLLITAKGETYLSWMTVAEGYRLIHLEPQP